MLDNPGIDSASNRNEYQGYLLAVKGGRWVGLTTLPPSYAECLEILGMSTSWNPKGFSRPVQGLIYINEAGRTPDVPYRKKRSKRVAN